MYYMLFVSIDLDSMLFQQKTYSIYAAYESQEVINYNTGKTATFVSFTDVILSKLNIRIDPMILI